MDLFSKSIIWICLLPFSFPRFVLERIVLCAFLCVLCDCVVSSSFSWAATPREELLRLVPDSVGFCLVVQDLRGHAADMQSSPFMEQLRQSPLGVKIRDKIKGLDPIESRLKEKLGLDWKQLREDIFGDAVVFAYRPGPPGQPEREQDLLLLRARNEKALAELIERINKVQKEEGELKELTERRHNGVAYYRRVEQDKRSECDKPSFYYVRGPLLAISSQEDMLRHVIDRDRNRSDAGTGEAARRLRELEAEQAMLAVWLNPRAFDAEVDAKAANSSGERAAAVKQFAVYWKALESVVVSLSPHERDIRLSLGMRARIADLPPATRRLFREAETASEVWRRFPESALLAAGGRVDCAALLDVMVGFLAPQGRQALLTTLNRPFTTLLSEEDFTGGLLPALGPDWGLCLSAPTTGVGGRPSERGNQGMPHILFALRIQSDRAKKAPERTLLTALDFAARFVVFAHNNQHSDSQLALKIASVNGQEVRYLTGEHSLPAGVQPAYGLLNGYLVLASSVESVNRFAQAPLAPRLPAGAPVPLLRISFKDWRGYLTENREPIMQFLSEHDNLSRDEAMRQIDSLLAGLQFVERAELSQRSSPNQVIFTLSVQTAHALKKR